MTPRTTLASTLAAALLFGTATARAQQPGQSGGTATPAPAGQAGQGRGGTPPPPQNLQVLPKDIPRQELLTLMRTYAQGLGVQCNYCHVQEGQGGRNDFATDEKAPKKTARVMMQMTMHNNEMLASSLGKPAAELTKVQCFTCHRGKTIPDAPPPLPPPGQQAAPAGQTPGR